MAFETSNPAALATRAGSGNVIGWAASDDPENIPLALKIQAVIAVAAIDPAHVAAVLLIIGGHAR